MTRILWKLALGISLATLASPSDVFAGRGGGRGGGGGGRDDRGGGSRGGGMGGTPSFSQPRQSNGTRPSGNTGYGDRASGNQPESGRRSQSGNPSGYANRNQSQSPSAAAVGAGYSNRNQSQSPSAAAAGVANRNQSQSPSAAAAGAGYANRNQNQSASAAAAGAGYANRNQNQSASAAAAGAGYANRNQNQSASAAAVGAGVANRNQSPSTAGAAAAGAGIANRNQSPTFSNAGAAAAGADVANRNQSPTVSNAGAAAAGAGYANRNQYDGYHPGVVNGYWNGNNSAAWGAAGYGLGAMTGVGAWGTGSPMYSYGYSSYSNPYSGSGGAVQQAGVSQQPGDAPQQTAAPASDYSQPISTTATHPEPAVADQATAAFNQAREAFKAGDYANALQLDQQALTQMPNDTTLHEFLALVLFAQGKYEQAAAPLYAVLSVGPGWDWTTLSGMYPDVATYTGQLRNLEAYVAANPNSAQGRFVLAYQYLSEGHDENAVTQLKQVVKLQPEDTLSAQLVARYQPSGDTPSAPAGVAPADSPAVDGKLPGKWVATPAKDANIALSIQDDGRFTWAATGQGKPPTTIAGASTFADGVLTLVDQGGQSGSLAGKVIWQNADHFTFRLAGAPPTDPGLSFAR
ncbi:tetratricopeptide repeat protein [Singulisphaera acidiphila]|uniref:Tetratricopeptide repeat protein n=1 Tax=Singulisphaera acidiphila (strain ATCC BAA-1392 / DSM 18658 / VKM B-2454 / MOB10) TaxID=886293 RepID=L0DE52_SINAD|nr:tetratricopeptide repeat protein [Singulisphaera acidiphila]AGA27108.1 hypothetical protein Sinac_2816 [Singulisphaera acidiphila DSM 18658]